jgi:hypothetical protein
MSLVLGAQNDGVFLLDLSLQVADHNFLATNLLTQRGDGIVSSLDLDIFVRGCTSLLVCTSLIAESVFELVIWTRSSSMVLSTDGSSLALLMSRDRV